MPDKPRNISVSLQCFIKNGDKYLMLHRSPHKRIMPNVWMAPGGRREFNEGLFACARREIMEETGLAVKNLRIKVAGCAYMEDINLELYFHFLVADYGGGKLLGSPHDGDFAWFTVEEISKLDNLLAEIKYVAPYLFDGTDNVISYTATYKTGNDMTDLVLESGD